MSTPDALPTSPNTANPGYDAGLLVAPADELTARTLAHGDSDMAAAGLLMAMLGWDGAMTELARSTHPRACQVMGALAAWLLLD